MRKLLLLIALVVAQPLSADSNLPPAYWSDRQLPDPRQEAQAQALMSELRCLVCQGQRYGSWISYKPTDEPAAWPLWLAPIALLIAGGWLIRRRIRIKAKR